MQSKNGLPASYIDALLQRNHNLAYKFPKGYMFFRVMDYEDTVVEFDQYNSLATVSASATLGTATTTKDWWKWQNADNIDIFREKDDGFMLQCFVGIAPASLRWWKRFPAPTARGNLSDIMVSTINGEAIGWVDGSCAGSPYDMPTEMGELIIPTQFPPLEFAVYNPEDITVTPVFKVVIRRLQVRALNPTDPADRARINDIITGRRAAKVYSPGIGGYEYDMTKHYGVCPIPWEVLS